ncbi:hypothetical protein BZG01_10540 [Labilibaculum manganireducens]|uniref:RagB/SusD domain-containing protein n=1 Tax=Labilibaculum manganireducens TaxID=1940525 RepID=A0A2N3I8P4_9BACT|nr:RagB/SusD family nutrient uptake outer membrane protein [Labilibaculum manganireducens]PKQ66702.1 hypothetical protein BZG01_10540 [Labilibaculum manganireducens]
MKTFKFVILFLFTVFIGCSKETDSIDDKTVKVSTLEGRVEKGPFTQGSTVTIQELSQNLSLTGKSFQTDISNNEGSFKIEAAIEFVSPYVQIACDGYFFNEVTGELSNSQIRLESFVDIANKRSINVNILTHISKGRIVNLMNEGVSYKDAALQAREELLLCFGLQKYKESDFEDLSISAGEDCSGALIIISSILLADRNEAELTEYISNLKETFTTSGTFQEDVIQSFKDKSRQLSTDDITSNIVRRYNDLGKKILVPDLKYYIDWDGDGIAGNELGDPHTEKQLFFEVDTVHASKEGGEFRVRIQANIPFTTNFDNSPNVISPESLFKEVELTSTINENEIIINVNPATAPFSKPKTITIYSHDGSLSAKLIIVQEGDFSNELSSEIITSIISKASTGFDYTHTIEGLYSNCYAANSSQWNLFSSHNLTANTSEISSAWAALYQLNHSLNSVEELVGSASSKYFTTLRALLYYHLTTLWGDTPYIFEKINNGNFYPSRTPIADIYTSLHEQLEECISGMSEGGNGSFFAVSKNVPRALLAKILIQQKQYSEALMILKEIISSGMYTLNNSRNEALSSASTEMIYAINKGTFSTPNHTNNIETGTYLPLIQYSEIILLAAECENKIGNRDAAITFLNKIRNRDGESTTSAESFEKDLKETWKSTMMGGFSYFAFLKRNNIAVSELNIQDYQKLLPIPSSETMYNPNVSQNPGY